MLAFLVDPEYDWPLNLYENYRLITERKTPGIHEEVDRNETKLTEFKQRLNQNIRATFTDAAGVRALVSEALADWRRRHPTVTTATPGDPEPYLKYLEDNTRQIRITGLKSKRAEPYFFGIDEIYIPLTTLATRERPGKEAIPSPSERRETLEHSLSHQTVIIGDPGSGKSTFLRRVAFELCRNLRDTRPDGAAPFLAAGDKRFPILIRTADLARLLSTGGSAMPPEAPDWIPHFLGKQSEQFHWSLDAAFFRRKLKEGNCLIMVDGLDEAPDRPLRERISRLFEQATHAFRTCDFLVTTRPQSYAGDSVLADFHQLRIGELELCEIQAFFHHFALALALPPNESKEFKQALESALALRFEIREMARNPVMLTALAVLQHNDQQLPEYRVELYDSILGWLAAARKEKRGRPSPDKCLEFMRKLALHMQDAPEGRLVQVGRRPAAELSSKVFGGTAEKNEDLVESETQDSGIIVAEGDHLKFWHLSFQEYLAAREIAGLNQEQLIQTAITSGKLYHPEWREVMRLLGGVLRLQGKERIEWLIQAILADLPARPKLPQRARCAALLGAMMRDLSRMDYTPQTPAYDQTVKAVMRIFDAATADKVDFNTRLEAADALGQAGDPRLDENNWFTIPAGTFRIGAQKSDKKGANYDPEAYDRESPVHEVTLPNFRIGRLPVTVQEFATFIDAGAYRERKHWKEGFDQFTEPAGWEAQRQFPSRPVVGVSWFEAAAYCAWAGGRLPTEAEWERAARGQKQGAKYPWGNTPTIDHSRTNYGNEVGHPTPVGLFPRGDTSEDLCDMLGNVWEWCGDWFGNYEPGPQENPVGPPTGISKVRRGGSWYSSPRDVRVSFRNDDEPAYRNDGIGFRCAGELSLES